MHLLFLDGTPDDRARAARAWPTDERVIVALDASTLPFTRVSTAAWPPPPRTILIESIEHAFPDNQARSTRLVLTQSTYLIQRWLDALDAADRIVATADHGALACCAPEALQRRGPWRHFDVRWCRATAAGERQPDARPGASRSVAAVGPTLPSPRKGVEDTKADATSPIAENLAAAYATSDAAERLRLCREATERDPGCEVAAIALASAYREHQDRRARDTLDRAAALAPDWEAVHFELGKLWLALDDTARARAAFQRAATLMPTFSAAFSNLGAALGELGDAEAALDAFRRALEHDPRSHTILSNVGVVSRELGRLEESAAALREATALAPDFVFGHYNLGHSLFLAGRYADAIASYEEGLRRDPQRNPRQACRLAMARFAAGDVAGAEEDLWQAVNRAAPDDREDLLLEAYEVAQALAATRPERPTERAFSARLAAEITKSE